MRRRGKRTELGAQRGMRIKQNREPWTTFPSCLPRLPDWWMCIAAPWCCLEKRVCLHRSPPKHLVTSSSSPTLPCWILCWREVRKYRVNYLWGLLWKIKLLKVLLFSSSTSTSSSFFFSRWVVFMVQSRPNPDKPGSGSRLAAGCWVRRHSLRVYEETLSYSQLSVYSQNTTHPGKNDLLICIQAEVNKILNRFLLLHQLHLHANTKQDKAFRSVTS